MDVRRGALIAFGVLVAGPLAIALAIILLIASLGGDKGFSASAVGGNLKVGKGGAPPQYAGLIQAAANACKEGLPAAILAAQLQAESGFDPTAQSKDAQGNPLARGIAQFIDSTWETEGVDGNGDGKKDVWDPEDAIPAQGKMMCGLLKDAKAHPEYNGSPIELALAGYNAGWARS